MAKIEHASLTNPFHKYSFDVCYNGMKLRAECYECHECIGDGGQGKVYRATRIRGARIGHLFAIKKIPCNKARFLKHEGRKLQDELLFLKIASQDNPGVVRLHKWYIENDVVCIVMELPLNSKDLFYFLEGCVTLTNEDVIFIFHQIVQAIQICHKNGIAHCDLKVENVMIDPISLSEKVTTLKPGTPECTPPEYFCKKRYRPVRLDVWCLGLILYRIFERREAFSSKEEIVNTRVTFTGKSQAIQQSGKELCLQLLNSDDSKRPKIQNILFHPWFAARPLKQIY